MLSSLVLLSAVIHNGAAFGREVTIHSVDDLIELSANINKGENYFGTTVLLDSDLDFTGQAFEPIGRDGGNYFNGTFDGQGHRISNLVMRSPAQHVGLFGYSEGLTIRNVVIGNSCSITSTYKSALGDGTIGGFVGFCSSTNAECILENNVNMGNVSFNGDNSEMSLYIGGIVGYAGFPNHDFTVKNCANHGPVTYAGKVETLNIGGIVGYSKQDVKYTTGHIAYIENCLNTGAISDNGKTKSRAHIGGVIGNGIQCRVRNSVSYGRMEIKEVAEGGGIAGRMERSYITHSYWAESSAEKLCTEITESEYLDNSAFESANFVLNESVSAGNYKGTSLIEALNGAARHYRTRDYSRWALNKDGKEVTFTVNGGNASSTLNSKIVLLPNLAAEGKTCFDGWYTDEECTAEFAQNEIGSNTELYGKYEENSNNYTITFDTRGGSSIEPIRSQFGSVVALPTSSARANCTVAFWETECEDRAEEGRFSVPAHDVMLYAVWKCTRIETGDDLIDFSKVVNSGRSNYNGTTVVLGGDVDLSGKRFEPIGSGYDKAFAGTFDGRGHRIRNLVVKSRVLGYVGLFGCSDGVTIRNVVLDETCLFESAASSKLFYASVGSILGRCSSFSNGCVVEGCENYGKVAVSGENFEVSVGGIVGAVGYKDWPSRVKDCKNYGAVQASPVSTHASVGGIAGSAEGDYYDHSLVTVEGCTNYGNVVFEGKTTFDLEIDGIVGHGEDIKVTGCANHGSVSAASAMHALGLAWILLAMLLIY